MLLAELSRLLFECFAQDRFVARFLRDAKKCGLGIQRHGEKRTDPDRVLRRLGAVTANLKCSWNSNFVPGHQSINDNGRADEWQWHKRHPNFRAGEILSGNGADLRADGRAGVHNERNQDVHVAFDCVGEGSITRRDNDLEKIGPDCEMRRDSQNVNHRRHPNVPGASAKKTAEQSADEGDQQNDPKRNCLCQTLAA